MKAIGKIQPLPYLFLNANKFFKSPIWRLIFPPKHVLYLSLHFIFEVPFFWLRDIPHPFFSLFIPLHGIFLSLWIFCWLLFFLLTSLFPKITFRPCLKKCPKGTFSIRTTGVTLINGGSFIHTPFFSFPLFAMANSGATEQYSQKFILAS